MRGSSVFGGNFKASVNPFESSASAFDALFGERAAAPAVDPHAVPENAPEGSYTYAVVQSEPAVPAEEVESAAEAVEVRVRWGESVLHVAHLAPPRTYFVGSDESKDRRADYVLPVDAVGALRAPLVLVDSDGSTNVVVFARAKARIEIANQAALSLEEAVARGVATPYPGLEGAHLVKLPHGAKARIESAGLVFELAAVNAGRKLAGRRGGDRKGMGYTALSAALHLGLLGAAAVFMPPLAMADDGTSVSAADLAMLQQMLATTAEKEPEQRDDPSTEAAQAKAPDGGTGARAMHEEGKMGSQTSSATNRRYAVAGPQDNPDPHVAKTNLLRDAGSFGMVGLVATMASGDPNAPTAMWGRDEALGNDAKSANGNMWGQEIGDAAGISGLGLTGIGEGGGGRYEGIGLGKLGTIGHGDGLGPGQGFGPGGGSSHGLSGSPHKPKGPTMRVAATSVSGHLPPEVIQRIVRQNFGRFRLCYENGLRSSPNLQGRVSVRFVIGRDGSVSNAANGGSDLPDSSVVSCVTRAFFGLSFPQPDDGIVTVTYPIMFSPGG